MATIMAVGAADAIGWARLPIMAGMAASVLRVAAEEGGTLAVGALAASVQAAVASAADVRAVVTVRHRFRVTGASGNPES